MIITIFRNILRLLTVRCFKMSQHRRWRNLLDLRPWQATGMEPLELWQTIRIMWMSKDIKVKREVDSHTQDASRYIKILFPWSDLQKTFQMQKLCVGIYALKKGVWNVPKTNKHSTCFVGSASVGFLLRFRFQDQASSLFWRKPTTAK